MPLYDIFSGSCYNEKFRLSNDVVVLSLVGRDGIYIKMLELVLFSSEISCILFLGYFFYVL